MTRARAFPRWWRTGKRAGVRRAAAAYRRWAITRRLDDPEKIEARAWKIVQGRRYCLVVTVGPPGPSARVVEPLPRGADGVIRFGTDPASRKVADIVETGRCLLVYQDDRRRACVTVECDAQLEETSSPRWFRQSWRAFWPEGPSNDDYVTVSCRPVAIEVWDGFAVIAPDPFGRRQARIELDIED
ncbi:MAG: pyridoxamine 5'-phosphate oxidase family protein [Angustibacter sp.]